MMAYTVENVFDTIYFDVRLSYVVLGMNLDFCCRICNSFYWAISLFGGLTLETFIRSFAYSQIADRIVPAVGTCPFEGSTHELLYMSIAY